MAKAISYRRFSSGQQAKGDSLKRQTEAAQAYCDAHGDDLDLSFVDPGMSAYRSKNATEGALKRLVELAEEGMFEPGTKLIVEHLDRLSRAELTTAQSQFQRILRTGVTIVTLADGQEYTYDKINSDLGSIVISIVMMFKAHEESALKGKRVAKAKASRRERVRASEGATKMTRQCPAWLKARGTGEKIQFAPMPERVAVVRRIFELSLAGLGKRAIMSLLNREGVPAFRGKDGWHHSSVAALLHNDRTLGYFHPSRVVDGKVVYDEAIADYYPPILDEATFYRAQEATDARKGPRAAGRHSTGLANLLSGLGTCAQCGANLVFETRGNRRRKPDTPPRSMYLVCGRALRHLGCDNDHHHSYLPIESELLRLLTLFDLARLLGPRGDPDAARAAALEAEIAAKTATVDRLLDAFEQASSPGATRRIQRLEAEIAKCSTELDEHRRRGKIAEANKGRDVHAEFVRLVTEMRSGDMPAEELYVLRSRIATELRRVIEEIVANDETLVVRIKAASPQRLEFHLKRGELVNVMCWSPEWSCHAPAPEYHFAPSEVFDQGGLFADGGGLEYFLSYWPQDDPELTAALPPYNPGPLDWPNV
jgi:DNA invertase Pin-like site-specific DNA recombinase